MLIYAAMKGNFDRLQIAQVTKFKTLLEQKLSNPAVYDLLVEANTKISLPAVYAVYDVLVSALISQL